MFIIINLKLVNIDHTKKLQVPLLCFHRGLPNLAGLDDPKLNSPWVSAMPAIHFVEVRARIPLADVLNLIGFVPCEPSGDQLRGPCPIHGSSTPTSRSFSAHLKGHVYKCFRCGSQGNQLDLYASVTRQSLFEAAIALCEQLHHEISWMQDGKPSPVR